MQPSSFKTVPVPVVPVVPGTNAIQPITLAVAQTVPLRVVVRNVGGTMIFLGFASQDVSGPSGLTPDIGQVPPGASDVFVLSPGQRLYASSIGGSLASVGVSEALPLDLGQVTALPGAVVQVPNAQAAAIAPGLMPMPTPRPPGCR